MVPYSLLSSSLRFSLSLSHPLENQSLFSVLLALLVVRSRWPWIDRRQTTSEDNSEILLNTESYSHLQRARVSRIGSQHLKLRRVWLFTMETQEPYNEAIVSLHQALMGSTKKQ